MAATMEHLMERIVAAIILNTERHWTFIDEETGQVMPPQVEPLTLRQEPSGWWVVRRGTMPLSTHPDWQTALQTHGMNRVGDAGVMSA